MATCKQCLHFDVCGIEKKIWESIEQTSDNMCRYFKDETLFLELPCKVGDMVYFADRNKIDIFTVEDINYSAKQNKNTFILANVSNNLEVLRVSFEHFIGYKLFLTREEAEKALKEFNNET